MSRTADQLARLGRLGALSRRGREQRRALQARLVTGAESKDEAVAKVSKMAGRLAQFRQDQDAHESFEAGEGWRREEITRLREKLDLHWVKVVTACVRADEPLAYGTDKVRQARATVSSQLHKLGAAMSPDPSDKLGKVHGQPAGSARTEREAEGELTRVLGQIDAALERTRAERVLGLASQPTAHLLDLLGPPPSSPGGRAVWCHYAFGIEAIVDRFGTLGSWPGKASN